MVDTVDEVWVRARRPAAPLAAARPGWWRIRCGQPRSVWVGGRSWTGSGWTGAAAGAGPDRRWSSPQIAAHLDSTVKTVLRTLHDHGIPVRRGGPPPRPDTRVDPRLTALYGDLETTALLRRYRIPRRHRPSGITDRFPTPARITPGFLRAAYLDIGLAPGTSSNSLTGHPAEQVLDLLHQHRKHRIPVRRAGGHSPWYRRQHHHIR